MPGIAVVFLDLVAYQEAILEKQRECGRDHGLGNNGAGRRRGFW
jgi:hypothetical protein